MSKFYKVSEDAENRFFDVFNKKSFPVNIGFEFIGSEKQKSLIKITKLSEQYEFLLGKEVMVTINDDLMSVFDDESISILIEQELDKISISADSGKIKMIKPDVNTFSALITKYGIDKISKANQVEVLYQQQKSDKESEDEFII